MIKSLFNTTATKKQNKVTWFFPWNQFTTGIIVIAALILILIVYLVFINNYSFDDQVITEVNHYIIPGRTRWMSGISFLGNAKFLVPAYLMLLFYFSLIRDKKSVITVSALGISGFALLTLLKEIIHRNRPAGRLVEGITNFSFPSGHALMSIVFYGLFIYWSAKFITNKWLQAFIISSLLVLILIIGFSRIYLKVHYFSDVIAGWCIGICWLFLMLQFFYKTDAKKINM